MSPKSISCRWYHHCIKNPDGSALMVSLLVLVTLTVIGLASLDTTTIEQKITRNEKVYRQNFNLADAAGHEAARKLANLDSDKDAALLFPSETNWMNDSDLNLKEMANWDDAASASSAVCAKARHAIQYVKREDGSSLKTGEISVNLYAAFGLSQFNGGRVLIQIGCRKPARNP